MDKFNSPEYVKSRASYTIQATLEYFVTLLVADAFLAKLLTYMGIKDSLIGIISSSVSLAFIFQLLALVLTRVKFSKKKLFIFVEGTSTLFFTLLYLIPFIPLESSQRSAIVVICILTAYIFKYSVMSMIFKWANSFVAPSDRAVFSANKELISLISGIVFTTVAGFIVDKYEGLGNIEGAFLFIAIGLLILNICNTICLINIKDEEADSTETEAASFKNIMKNTLGNKNFRNVIYMTILWYVALYFSIGFMGTFKTNDLKISVFTVQLINIIANIARMLVTKPFGRYSANHSYAKGFKLALCIAACAFFINIFTTASTWYFIIIFTVLYSACNAGINANSFNITYSYVDSKYISHALAIKNSIGGVCGFASALVAGEILDLINANGNSIFGIHIFGQQFLSAISFVLIVVTIIFTRLVIEKQKIMVQ